MIGEELIGCIKAREFSRVKDLCSDDVVFTAATPGCVWNSRGWDEVETDLKELFPEEEKMYRVLEPREREMKGRFHFTYRVQGDEPDFGEFEYEHQMYYQMTNGKISKLRILCSGLYKPDSP